MWGDILLFGTVYVVLPCCLLIGQTIVRRMRRS